MKRIGVLALQGGFDAHLRTLRSMGVAADLVRTYEEIAAHDALILPGGESTTIGKLLTLRGLFQPLRDLLADGFPALGTCAGLILLAKAAQGRDQELLGVLDVDVARNAYGRQTESFETTLRFGGPPSADLPAVFIRAPQIVRLGDGVQTLALFEGKPVCVRQGRLIGAAFHPELTGSTALHDYFVSLV